MPTTVILFTNDQPTLPHSRVKDANDLENAFNVDAIYLKYDKQGVMPDYRVRSWSQVSHGAESLGPQQRQPEG